MGLGPAELEPLEIHGVGGQVDAFRPHEPFAAWVVGLEHVGISCEPVVVDESRQELSLILPAGVPVVLPDDGDGAASSVDV